MGVDSPPTLPLLLLWALGSSSDSGSDSAGWVSLVTPYVTPAQQFTCYFWILCILYNLATAHCTIVPREVRKLVN